MNAGRRIGVKSRQRHVAGRVGMMAAPREPRSVLITGGASGIGRCLVEHLCGAGDRCTAVDVDAAGLEQLAAHGATNGWQLLCCPCDVRDNAALRQAFARHADRWGRLDAALLVAGIGERGEFLAAAPAAPAAAAPAAAAAEEEDDPPFYQATLDIDLTAVVAGVRIAAQTMMRQGRGGHILSVASAAGFFPVPAAPTYAAAKAGVIHLTRSLAPRLAARGIALATVCPQYVDTPLVAALLRDPVAARAMLGPLLHKPLLRPQQVADLVCQLLARPLPEKRDAAAAAAAAAAAPGGGQGGCVYLLLQDGRVWDPWGGASSSSSGSVVRGSSKPPAPPPPQQQQQQQPPSSSSSSSSRSRSEAALRAFAAASAAALPRSFGKLQVVRLSRDFRGAVARVAAPTPTQLPPGHVLVRRCWAGVNASDINYTSGRYHGSAAAAERALPYDAGFESVGVVVAAGPPASPPSSDAGADDSSAGRRPPPPRVAVGQAVATMEGGFSEYGVVHVLRLLLVPEPTPQVLALMTSGLTAAIALEQAGGLVIPWGATATTANDGSNDAPALAAQQQRQQRRSGDAAGRGPGSHALQEQQEQQEQQRRRRRGSGADGRKVVLVTAAAGGTGQFAVQLAKLAGCCVVATCGGPDKAALLRDLGADRVIDHRCEDVRSVLRSEHPDGVDLVYESVGGAMFEAALDALAPRGTLLVIGMMSAYGAGWPASQLRGLPEKLLWKSASVTGFFLLKFAHLWGPYMSRLVALAGAGRLRVALDAAPFVGLDAVPDAVDRLQSGASSGKVVVRLSQELPGGGAWPQPSSSSKL